MNKANAISFQFDPKLDEEYLIRMYAGDLSFAHDMFQLYMDTVADALPALQEALRQQDIPQLGSWIHKLRPCYAMVGLDQLYQAADRMEDRGVENYAWEDLSRLVSQIIDETQSSLKIIQSDSVRLHEAMQSVSNS
ncbi:MAG: Hpt domain-containing protein [Bacteroidota bacterium]